MENVIIRIEIIVFRDFLTLVKYVATNFVIV